MGLTPNVFFEGVEADCSRCQAPCDGSTQMIFAEMRRERVLTTLDAKLLQERRFAIQVHV